MKAYELIADALSEQGADVVFALLGDGNMLALAALVERHGAGDRIVDREFVPPRQIPAHVPLRKLIDEHRHELQIGKCLAIVMIAFEDFAEDDVGVRPRAVHGCDGGHGSGFVGGHGWY